MTTDILFQDRSSAADLSDYLRNGDDPELHRRRRIIGLSMLSAGMMGAISLWQTGLVRRVPKPPTRWLDGTIVNGSPQAYRVLKTPDAFLGMLSYGLTAMLAAMGGRQRAERSPLIPIALAGKAAADAAVAAKLAYDQPTKYRAFCPLCVVAIAATFVTLPLALRDATRAIQKLR